SAISRKAEGRTGVPCACSVPASPWRAVGGTRTRDGAASVPHAAVRRTDGYRPVAGRGGLPLARSPDTRRDRSPAPAGATAAATRRRGRLCRTGQGDRGQQLHRVVVPLGTRRGCTRLTHGALQLERLLAHTAAIGVGRHASIIASTRVTWEAAGMDAPVIDAQTPTLSEVTPSALGALGVSGFVDDLGFGARTSICVLLVDGLGWELLDAHAADAPVLAELWKRPLRVGYPATTAAGLAAIGTGVPPGEHGMVGYSFEVPEVGVLNVLRWRRHPDGEYLYDVVSPEEVQTRPTLFAVAAEAGVATTVVSEAQFEGTPLTRAVLSGGTYVGVHALGDLAAAVSTALRERRGFCYAYHGDLDFIGHLYGPGSVPWRLQLRQVDRLVESLVENLPRGAALAVVADHGM